MSRKQSHARTLVAAFVALVLAAAVFAGGVAVGSAGGAQASDVEPGASPESVALPSWFLPTWDYYGRNPEITPWFDFASLYAGTPDAAAIRATATLPHGAAVAGGPQGPWQGPPPVAGRRR
jgi:hypothetical protein